MDCSSCGAQPISSVYCQHCKDVNLDFSAQDHFSVFHLPLQYSLAKDVLEERYLKLSRVTHPDLVCGEIKKDPRLLALSSFVNESYRVLKDDFLRAEAMLKYYSEGLSLDGNALPPCFLMDMLELQEEVESYASDPEKFEDELEKVESKKLQSRSWVSITTYKVSI